MFERAFVGEHPAATWVLISTPSRECGNEPSPLPGFQHIPCLTCPKDDPRKEGYPFGALTYDGHTGETKRSGLVDSLGAKESESHIAADGRHLFCRHLWAKF